VDEEDTEAQKPALILGRVFMSLVSSENLSPFITVVSVRRLRNNGGA
jgi:hypothetical protein